MFGILTPTKGGDPIPLPREKMIIGRRNSCDIQLEFPNISSHHCELELVNGHWWVRDLNSRNGIKVNDERCLNRILLPGDRLSIAKHEFEISYQATGTPPPSDLQEDIFSMSLMEKAGLERVRRPSSGPRKPPLFDPGIRRKLDGTLKPEGESPSADSSSKPLPRSPNASPTSRPKVDDDDVASWLTE